MVDGNGVLHTRAFGAASHIGVKFNIPSVGVAKKTFYVDGLSKEKIQNDCKDKLNNAGDFVHLVGNSGRTWGAALRCTEDSINPIYVSIGHRMSLDTAVNLVNLTITKYRIPEPIR